MAATAAPHSLIEARGLTKRFGDFTAVEGIDFLEAPWVLRRPRSLVPDVVLGPPASRLAGIRPSSWPTFTRVVAGPQVRGMQRLACAAAANRRPGAGGGQLGAERLGVDHGADGLLAPTDQLGHLGLVAAHHLAHPLQDARQSRLGQRRSNQLRLPASPGRPSGARATPRPHRSHAPSGAAARWPLLNRDGCMHTKPNARTNLTFGYL